MTDGPSGSALIQRTPEIPCLILEAHEPSFHVILQFRALFHQSPLPYPRVSPPSIQISSFMKFAKSIWLGAAESSDIYDI